MRSIGEYKKLSFSALKGAWVGATLSVLIFFLVQCLEFCSLYILVLGILVTLFVSCPLEAGVYNAFRRLYLHNDRRIVGNVFRIAFSGWRRNGGAIFLRRLYVFLWSLCFIVPGIIKALSYAMTPYILDDYPDIEQGEALKVSEEMMKGHKARLLRLHLSFLGWWILGLMSFGIGLLWVIPYRNVALAAFYDDLKEVRQESAL